MPLNWDVSRIPENIRTITTSDGQVQMNPVTNTIIMLSMVVGLGEITEKNWPTFFERLAILQDIDGPFLHNVRSEKGEAAPIWITDEDVRNHIGLRTNVSNDASWNRRFAWKLLGEAKERGIKKCTKIGG